MAVSPLSPRLGLLALRHTAPSGGIWHTRSALPSAEECAHLFGHSTSTGLKRIAAPTDCSRRTLVAVRTPVAAVRARAAPVAGPARCRRLTYCPRPLQPPPTRCSQPARHCWPLPVALLPTGVTAAASRRCSCLPPAAIPTCSYQRTYLLDAAPLEASPKSSPASAIREHHLGARAGPSEIETLEPTQSGRAQG